MQWQILSNVDSTNKHRREVTSHSAPPFNNNQRGRTSIESEKTGCDGLARNESKADSKSTIQSTGEKRASNEENTFGMQHYTSYADDMHP
jgi:hypothetical protein